MNKKKNNKKKPIKYKQQNAKCCFCNGEMPCFCPEPNDIEESIDNDLDLRNDMDL